jgi:hypothetical protein
VIGFPNALGEHVTYLIVTRLGSELDVNSA